MTPTNKTSPAETTVRHRAEDVVRASTASVPDGMDDLSPGAMKDLIHELRVHQIELEMQNSELRRMQAAA